MIGILPGPEAGAQGAPSSPPVGVGLAFDQVAARCIQEPPEWDRQQGADHRHGNYKQVGRQEAVGERSRSICQECAGLGIVKGR